MPYRASGRLEDMINPGAVDVAGEAIALEALEEFQDYVKDNTPIDTNPYRDRPGRPRGAARDSVERSRVVKRAGAWRGSVFTEDEVFPFIEWDTPPHTIRPKDPDGWLSWRDRRTGERIFAKEVRHPGTKGQHSFAIGAAKTEAELERIAQPALAAFARDLVRVQVRSVDRRAR